MAGLEVGRIPWKARENIHYHEAESIPGLIIDTINMFVTIAAEPITMLRATSLARSGI